MLKALKAVQEDRPLAERILKIEFPTLSDEALKASLDRAYADDLWSPDGFISRQAVDTDMDGLIQSNGFMRGRGTMMNWSICSSSKRHSRNENTGSTGRAH